MLWAQAGPVNVEMAVVLLQLHDRGLQSEITAVKPGNRCSRRLTHHKQLIFHKVWPPHVEILLCLTIGDNSSYWLLSSHCVGNTGKTLSHLILTTTLSTEESGSLRWLS